MENPTEGRPAGGSGKASTPATPETTTGGATETHGVNTNLSPDMQGGPTTAADQAASQEIAEQQQADSSS